MVFWTICLQRSFGDLHQIQLSTHAMAAPFMSGHRLLRLRRHRLRCDIGSGAIT